MTKISNLYSLTNYITANTSGNVVIEAPTSGSALYVTGAGTVTGQLTLGSTITNGTNTYTLPSATGTLALTSSLGSYLPLAGGTLTGALNGTSGTFSGNVSTSAQLRIESSGNAILLVGSRTAQTVFEIYNSTNVLRFYNGTNEALKIETGAGAATFSSSITANGSVYSNGNLAAANGNQTANTISAVLYLGNRGYFSSPDTGAAAISSISTGANWYSGTAMAFYTNPGPDVTGTAPVERMRITSGGNLLIGTTTDAGQKLQVAGAAKIEGAIYRYNGQTVVGGSATTLVNIDFASSRTYLLSMIPVNVEANLSYRWFGTLQYNYNSNLFVATALVSQTMDITMSGGTIQARVTNGQQWTFNWSITQLL